jgi:hypothetical protein
MWSSSCFVQLVQKPLQYLRSAAAGLEGSHSVRTKVVVVWARQVHRAHVAGFTPPGSATVGRPSVAAFGQHQTSGWCENIVAIRKGVAATGLVSTSQTTPPGLLAAPH